MFANKEMEKFDVAIIGAGVMGASVAYYLSHYHCDVVVLEMENDVAEGSSIANSGIVHSGHDPKPNTLKARFNVEGNRLYPELCKELDVLYQKTGAFVVATNEEERQTLEVLKKQAAERGIPWEELSGEEAKRREPNLSEGVCQALSLPTTGVVDPWEITLGLMETAVVNGCDLRLNQKVVGIKKEKEQYTIYIEETRTKSAYRLQADYIINCGGVHGDDIFRLLVPNASYRIRPRRGQYFVLDNTISPIVTRPIYPVPSKVGKGILAIPTIHGNVLLGPDSEWIEDKDGVNTEKARLDFIRQSLQKTIQNIPYDKVIRSFSGLRATGNTEDFLIGEEKEYPHFIQAIGIESPGLTSAPAIGKYITEEILLAPKQYPLKENYQARRRVVRLSGKGLAEKNEWVKKDERFGRIICRCESMSEGEILDCIQRPVGATTVKAVKKRARAGAGRCQGGFCEPRVVEILARELQISPLEVLYDSSRSPIFVEETKTGKGERYENR